MLYSFLHATVRRSFLGAAIRSWLVNTPIILALFLPLLGYSVTWTILILVLDVMIRLLYWKARRDGYVYFVAENARRPNDGTLELTTNRKVPVRATGFFGTKKWEEYVLAHPADYWRVPMGDHAIMVRYSPGRFLYQFIQPDAVESLESGVICCGAQPKNALAITYLSRWVPETQDVNFLFYAPSDEDDGPRKRRKIYLAFEDAKTKDTVWQNFINAGRQEKDEDS
jgi:hypothetical protein